MEDILVIVDSRSAVSRSGDDTSTTPGQQPLQDLHPNRSFANTSEEGSLLGVGNSGGRDFRQDIKICCLSA